MSTGTTVEALKNRIRQLESDSLEYQRIEEELRASQEQFRVLIDTIPNGILENSIDGIITFSNRAFHRICGYQQGELIGKAVWDLVVDPIESNAMPGLLKKMAKTQPRPEFYITQVRTKSDSLIDVQVAWDYKRDSRSLVSGYISIITDITERLKADRALKDSELRYRTLFEKAGDAIFLIEAEGSQAGAILDANQAAADMHGYTIDELKSMNIKEVDGPEAADQVAGRLARIACGEWIVEEITHRKKNGDLVPVSLSAGLVHLGEKKAVLGIDRDITERKEAEERLKISEMRYRAIFEGSGEGILLADAETKCFRYANPAICAFLGYSESEFSGMSIQDIHPDHSVVRVFSDSQDQTNGENTLTAQTPCLRKDGSIVYADIRSGRIQIDGKRHIVGFFADVTEQMGIKAALNEQVHFLQTLIDTLPHPIYYKDVQGRYMGCNQAFENFLGKSKKELLDKTVYDIEPRDLADDIYMADRALFASKTPQIYEGRIRLADGTAREVVFNKAVFYRKDGSIGGLVGGIMDITNLKRIEQEKDLLATAIEQTPEMVIMTDLKGNIHYVNPAFERITGYSRNEAIGRTPGLLQSGHHAENFYKNLWVTLERQKIWKGRLTNRRKDGVVFEVEATIMPVQRKDGKVTDYLAVERDITQEIQREQQLRQAQKMEAIGTLAGGIAHDFNNILSAIIGFTEITLHDLPKETKACTYLGKVLTASDRARGLVNQILAFSRATEQEAKPVEVKLIIKEVLKLMQATLPSTISITSRIETSDAIMADPTQIHQVVMNLCTNAAHAMQAHGGELHIALLRKDPDEETHRRHPNLKPSGPYLQFIVSDTGCGMAPELLDRIFDPFFTTKRLGEGTGMGLSVVHGIIKACAGSIHVHSVPNQGSEFEILLPIIEKKQLPPKAMEAFPGGENEKILFVDDEPFQVDLGEQLLQRLGYQVTAVSDSRKALELFCKKPDDYDLVITDMTMPAMTGDELARKILAVRPAKPVIICTGFSSKLTDQVGQSIGIAGIAHKPLIMKEMAKLIRQALDSENRQNRDLKP